MTLAIGIACFVLAIVAFLWGFVTEYRQSRDDGPVAIVPTLPFAVAAALLMVLGLAYLRLGIYWWVYPIAFAALLIVFGWAIVRANGRHGA